MKTKKPQLRELNDEEKNILLPVFIRFLQQRTNDRKHFTCDKLVEIFSRHKEKIGIKSAINSQRIMKMTNYIRAHQLLPLMSGPTGYYVSHDEETIEYTLESLEDRVKSQMAAIEGLRNFLQMIRVEKEINKVETCPLGFEWR